LIKKKTQDEDTFPIVWMLLLQSIQSTSIEVYEDIKNCTNNGISLDGIAILFYKFSARMPDSRDFAECPRTQSHHDGALALFTNAAAIYSHSNEDSFLFRIGISERACVYNTGILSEPGGAVETSCEGGTAMDKK
jgi:hypothetical protein